MSVSAMGSSSSSSSGSSNTSSSATNSLMGNYDMFLTLLTAQLKTQSPLDPMDASTFTNQLVQYSNVEQSILSNQKLDSLLSTMVTSSALQLVNYIGKSVTAYSDATQFKDGKATWGVDSNAASTGAAVTITNSSGSVVYKGTMNLKAGENTFAWDGKGVDGTDWSSSTDSFTIAVSGTDDSGKAVEISTKTSGVVSGVDTSGSQPYLKLGKTTIPLSSVISIDQ